jgi:1-aminocyclopropane-1-carboxylate synthase
VKPVCVSVGEDDVTGLAAVSHHEKALIQAEKNGTKVKGLMLCNPHNPLGRCYSKEVIEAYLALCSKYNIHLIRYSSSLWTCSQIPNKTQRRSLRQSRLS